MDDINIKNLNDVDMIKIDDNIGGDDDIENGIKVVDKNVIIRELNLSEDEFVFLDDLITNYEKNLAKHVANYQACTMAYLGTIRLNEVRENMRKYSNILHKIYETKGKESYMKFSHKLAMQFNLNRKDKNRKRFMEVGNYHPDKYGEGILKLVDKDNNRVRINIANYIKIMTKEKERVLRIPKKYELQT